MYPWSEEKELRFVSALMHLPSLPPWSADKSISGVWTGCSTRHIANYKLIKSRKSSSDHSLGTVSSHMMTKESLYQGYYIYQLNSLAKAKNYYFNGGKTRTLG